MTKDHFQGMDRYFVTHILDFNLLQQVKDLINQLKKVSTALGIMQADSTTIADACHFWCNLIKDDNLKPHFEKVKKKCLKKLFYLVIF